jgi:hypothetical protein
MWYMLTDVSEEFTAFIIRGDDGGGKFVSKVGQYHISEDSHLHSYRRQDFKL